MAGAGSAQRERAKEERGVESSLSVCNRRQSRVHVDDGICVSASALLHSWVRPPPHDAGLRRARQAAFSQRFSRARRHFWPETINFVTPRSVEVHMSRHRCCYRTRRVLPAEGPSGATAIDQGNTENHEKAIKVVHLCAGSGRCPGPQ